MILEAIVLVVVSIVLMSGVYWTASVAKRLLLLKEKPTGGNGLTHRRQRQVLDLVTRPRDIILTADLFKSLAFLITVGLIVWVVPSWSVALGWFWVPSLVLALGIVWLVRVIVGEVMPRVHLMDDNVDSLPRGATLFVGLSTLMRPLLSIVRKMGGSSSDAISTEEREEILERTLETLSRSAGTGEPIIEDDEREMIQGVIGLENTEVREVMVPRIHIVALEANATIDDVRRTVREHGHSRLPIYEDDLDTIIGILYVKDLITVEGDPSAINLVQMARDAFVVPETKRVDALLEEFKRRNTHIAIVVDEFGGTAGLVTLEDILEEIVGEIRDEHDIEGDPIERISADTIMADGVVPLYEVADALDVELPDEKFETVGGLLYDRFGGIPTPGYRIEEHGLGISVEEMDGQRISRVKIQRLKPSEPSPS
ncbi:MAG: hypothetical protein Kow0074_03140 [Candidatus Zixiibacteriota bacterium]